MPPTRNESINAARQNKFAAANLKKKWDHRIAQSCALVLDEMKSPIWVALHYKYLRNSQDHDNIDGSRKYIFDGLVKAGIIKNDNLNNIQDCTFITYEKAKDTEVKVILFDDFNEYYNYVVEELKKIKENYE